MTTYYKTEFKVFRLCFATDEQATEKLENLLNSGWGIGRIDSDYNGGLIYILKHSVEVKRVSDCNGDY